MSQPIAATTRSTRPLLLGRLSAVALLAGLGAACSANTIRLTEPVFTGSTPNQQQILASQAEAYTPPAYQAPSSGPAYPTTGADGVYSANLPPPAGAPAAGNAPQPGYGAPPPVAAGPQPYTPPKPYAAAGLPTPVGTVGPTAHAAPPPPVQTAPTQIAALPAPGTPTPRGAPPTTLGEQARSIQPAAAPAATAGGNTYRVQSGDSLWSIARQHGVTTDQLSAANGLSGAPLKAGQVLTIPGASPAGAGVQVASVNPTATVDAPQPGLAGNPIQAPVATGPQPLTPANPAPSQQAALTPQAPPPAAVAPAAQPNSSAGAPSFRWPVRGRIIAGFGKRPNGERNEGINLAVPEGTSVKAAEDGEVIYAGNELKSYGNLVLIRHSNGYVSAYAHNKELKVRKGDAVRRGEIVALSGMTGGVTTPQLHFELRKGATPIDPVSQLSDL
ncbi:peptidoglycan DD-metalloendopeptidase family protein [Faunimonas sp. B44]|uniref:peptidoglycan DD-metalloendopeptidase family protein n=1 Tax=Faunimonas sp. B44 TaxID=3461493 RepID=UPI004043C84A